MPVINLCANYNEVDDTINRMELYYPISPRIAIICKNTIKNNETIQVNDETVIDMYNKKILMQQLSRFLQQKIVI